MPRLAVRVFGGGTTRAPPDAPLDSVDAFGGPFNLRKLNTTNEYKILSPLEGQRRFWRSWQRFTRNKKGEPQVEPQVERFAVYDGRQFRQFRRDRRTPEHGWNEGLILAFEQPSCFQENVFESFLCLTLQGPELEFQFGQKLPPQFAYHVTGQSQEGDLTIWNLESKHNNVQFKVEVSGAPEFLVRRLYAEEKGKPIQSYEVTQVKTFEGFAYPAAGRFRQWPLRYLNGQTYEFRVTSVSRLGDEAREPWFSDWPTTTIIRNHVENQNFSTPREVDEN